MKKCKIGVSSIEDPVFLLERNLYGHPLAGLLGKGNLRKSCCSTVGRRFPNWECLFVHREKGLFLSLYVDDIKLAGKKQNLDPMWKLLNKSIWKNQHLSLIMYTWDALKDNVK